MPDAQPPGWIERIERHSEVIPVPLQLSEPPVREPPSAELRARGPVILWNHRWEHDKNPEEFFGALERLSAEGVPFRLVVCGQSFARVPEVFDRARSSLAKHIVHFGSVPERADYERWLARADVAVSTAVHEFFGISMIEAAHFGARPLVPDRLCYPEIFEAPCRYRDGSQLVSRLRQLCLAYIRGEDIAWAGAAGLRDRFGVDAVVPRFERLFASLVQTAA
jgi:glycosyltransferase involved in cell wall biosynthesis